MLDFIIDQEKCTQCGECAADCPAQIIDMTDAGPVIPADSEEACMQCQHCLAICKPGALSILGKDPADSIPLKDNLPTPQQMETLLKGRRSTRRFRDEQVDKELIASLLDTVANAPTGVNNRSTLLTVVDDKDVMDRLRKASIEAALKAVADNAIPAGMERMADYYKRCEDGYDIIFRGAPHLLVASSPSAGVSPEPDCLIALSYFELLANSYGLGTVWDGIAKFTLTMVCPEVGKLLGIPEDHTVGYMMAFGKPALKYHRTVQRPGGSVNRVSL